MQAVVCLVPKWGEEKLLPVFAKYGEIKKYNVLEGNPMDRLYLTFLIRKDA